MTGIKIKGLTEVTKGMKKGAKKPIADSLKNIGIKGEAIAKKATVVDTGRLRASITRDTKPNLITIGTNVEYAESIEYGTDYMEARHMEGGMKILGQGMFDYTIEQLAPEIKAMDGDISKSIDKAIK